MIIRTTTGRRSVTSGTPVPDLCAARAADLAPALMAWWWAMTKMRSMDILAERAKGDAKSLINHFWRDLLYDKIDNGPGNPFKNAFQKLSTVHETASTTPIPRCLLPVPGAAARRVLHAQPIVCRQVC